MLRPENEEQLAEIVRGANAPLSLRGGATRHIPGAGEPLTTAGLTGITLYEPGALTLVARAGTPIAEVKAALAAEGQRLPFEPMDHRSLLGTTGEPTIGGAVAMNVSGPRRVQAGACRDSLIGVRFVDGEGTVIKNGGRVMKNVTGYDLVKLMAGARGSLGILSEVSFKVLPAAPASASLLIEGLGVERAVACMSKALASPYEVNGAAHVPVGLDGTPVTMLRVEGLEGSVAYRAAELKALLSSFGDVTIERRSGRNGEHGVENGWAWVRDVKAFEGSDGDIWRVSVRPSLASHIVERAGADGALLDWGGGLVWLRVPEGADLRTRLGVFAGHATRVRGAPDLQPEVPALAALTSGIRAKFDPKGLFLTSSGA
ncbi:glycolate oxidase FAD binding subunit [Jannaschia faecimaris]|uniref:Glycolate oxidase FAD binding subunit n=1 Tax=Jannaschia faecimaris TaxID=1244108 RepID=A0A1H3UE04_9RHOB|nr:FAD-binding protein [Jannaschia faecimaris]SDZ60517.1 glycolate oxidase FAD binding subunit [Jannaschia faecimaris]